MTSRVNQLSFQGKVQRRDLGIPLLQRSGDAVLVERGGPRLLVLRCPCGCGDDLLINLDQRAGPAWCLYRTRRGLTLYPSYWRDDGCGSHFILWNNQIYWCREWETDESDGWLVASGLEERVYAVLPDDWFINYEQLAEQLQVIPWEALQACRQLAKQGKALGDKWPRHGMYRRLQSS